MTLLERKREAFEALLTEIRGPVSAENLRALFDKYDVSPITDPAELVEDARRAIAENPKAVADFRAGKKKALNVLKGPLLRYGCASPEAVEQALLIALEGG